MEHTTPPAEPIPQAFWTAFWALIDEPPPVLGNWRRVYVVVLAYEALVIALFYWFTRAFS